MLKRLIRWITRDKSIYFKLKPAGNKTIVFTNFIPKEIDLGNATHEQAFDIFSELKISEHVAGIWYKP